MLTVRLSMRVCVCACMSAWDVVSAISMVCIDRYVSSASWDKEELIRFWGQKVKAQGHQMEAYRA